jgi:superfamily II DNA or RNA helicase
MSTPDQEVTGKQLYAYQHAAIERIFEKLKDHPKRYNLLYQLPTGGGKTVIFSEITRRYIRETGKKVMILTHRLELCGQTSAMLEEFGVSNKIINSAVKELPVPNTLCVMWQWWRRSIIVCVIRSYHSIISV